FAAFEETATESRIEDQFANGDFADLNFVITGLSHVTAQADNARASIVRRAEPGEFGPAHLHDVFHGAQRLDVVDDGGTHIKPEHRREIRRLDARIWALPFERF